MQHLNRAWLLSLLLAAVATPEEPVPVTPIAVDAPLKTVERRGLPEGSVTWDLGELHRSFLALTPDESSFVILTQKQVLRLIRIKDMTELRKVDLRNPVADLCVCSEGFLVADPDGDRVMLLDFATLELRWKTFVKHPADVAASPKGAFVYVSHDETAYDLMILDPKSGKDARSIKHDAIEAKLKAVKKRHPDGNPGSRLLGLQVTPDGKNFLQCSGSPVRWLIKGDDIIPEESGPDHGQIPTAVTSGDSKLATWSYNMDKTPAGHPDIHGIQMYVYSVTDLQKPVFSFARPDGRGGTALASGTGDAFVSGSTTGLARVNRKGAVVSRVPCFGSETLMLFDKESKLLVLGRDMLAIVPVDTFK